jgi:hypothetical protein
MHCSHWNYKILLFTKSFQDGIAIYFALENNKK